MSIFSSIQENIEVFWTFGSKLSIDIVLYISVYFAPDKNWDLRMMSYLSMFEIKEFSLVKLPLN